MQLAQFGSHLSDKINRKTEVQESCEELVNVPMVRIECYPPYELVLVDTGSVWRRDRGDEFSPRAQGSGGIGYDASSTLLTMRLATGSRISSPLNTLILGGQIRRRGFGIGTIIIMH